MDHLAALDTLKRFGILPSEIDKPFDVFPPTFDIGGQSLTERDLRDLREALDVLRNE